MKWFSRVLLGAGIISLVLLAGYSQFGRDVQEANADVVVTPWPTSATTGTHLMVVSMTASSTWIAPDGVTAVVVEAWGAGGAARPTTADACGGGGGYARSLVSVTPGNPYWIQVGGREPMATSTFATTTVVAAPGWSWTNGSAPGAAASSTGDIKYSGTGLRAGSYGASAGDSASAVPGFYGGASNGAPYSQSFDKVLQMPGAGGCDIGDLGALGMVRLSYSSSSLSGFPYVRARNWERKEPVAAETPSIRVPTTTQVGDVLFAMVEADLFDPVTIGSIACYTNCGGWTTVYSTTTSGTTGRSGMAFFRKTATSTIGNDFTVTTTKLKAGWSNYWTYVTWALGNADDTEFFYATSSGDAATLGNPPSLNTGTSAKYLWIAGASTAASNAGIFCIKYGATGTMGIPPVANSAGRGLSFWEFFKEQSTYDHESLTYADSGTCTSPGFKDPFSFTFAIAGIAAVPGGSPTFLQRPQRIINIW